MPYSNISDRKVHGELMDIFKGELKIFRYLPFPGETDGLESIEVRQGQSGVRRDSSWRRFMQLCLHISRKGEKSKRR